MKYIILLSAVLLAGCAGNSLMPDVNNPTSDPHSFGCLQGMYSGTWANGNFQGRRLRFPDGFDVSAVSPEQLQALADVLCD